MILLYIQSLKVNNYRNLDGISICFHDEVSFIVGENNIGKTNILDLLHTIFVRRGFSETDFRDPDKEIRIEVKMGLHKGELGVFDDYSSIEEDMNSIELLVIQETVDDNIHFYEKHTQDEIYRNHIKKAHFISYGSVRNPDKELNFNTRNNFLNKLIEINIKGNDYSDGDYLNMDEIDTLVDKLNEVIGSIKTFKLFDIEARADDDITSLLGRIIQLQAEDKFEIKDLGEGAQFLNSIPLVLLNQISQILDQVNNDSVITIDDEKILYLIITIDEPELHLHPHSQRFFINYLTQILSGKNPKFNSLLKTIFGLDRIQGQLVIVTHSPYVLMDDYKQIVRVFRESNDKVEVKSGMNITLTGPEEKRIYSHMYEWKEAFYSQGVLLVEGISEKGAFKSFFERLDFNIDLHGINIIEVDGYYSMPALIKLFNKLRIHVVGVVDQDDREIPTIEESRFDDIREFIYQTNKREFEDEINSYIDFKCYLDLLPYASSIPNPYSSLLGSLTKIEKDKPNGDVIKCPTKLYGFFIGLTEEEQEVLYSSIEESFLERLAENKGYNLGVQIGRTISEVPQVYVQAIEALMELIQNE